MGKKKQSKQGLGRALIKDRFGGGGQCRMVDSSMLHTTEVQDGYDWGRLNLQSVTEESSFQEFLSTAELAGTEFQAEKLNIKFVNPRCNIGLLSKNEMQKTQQEHDKYSSVVKIPRRPIWNADTTPEQLQINEREAFLDWRRSLAKLQEDQGLLLTPYEKNLEFWRQLWRVVERSDVVVQIVDARNPLLFRCEDLEAYVKEVSSDKINVILVNKADFLTEKQREYWSEYFSSVNVDVAFYSAVLAAESSKIEEESDEGSSAENEEDNAESDEDSSAENEAGNAESNVTEETHQDSPDNDAKKEEIREGIENLSKAVEEVAEKLDNITKQISNTHKNTSKLLTRTELVDYFKTIHKGRKITPNVSTIGLVGYPNVGKSSTINSILTYKKVSVSATPGKTKHFQTMFVDDELMLCDCPGLVMPSFVFTKAEMVVNGILPIDQMRDHVPPVNLVASLIPRHVIEDKYGIMLAAPMEGEDENRPPTSEELLNAYAYNRGFMTANGQPDNPRAARYVLKDFVNGKLLYAHAPPEIAQTDFHTWPERTRIVSENHVLPVRQSRAIKAVTATTEDVDKQFFQHTQHSAHVQGKSMGIPSSHTQQVHATGKPWKKANKHEKKNKREKLRRVYAHLDQH